MRSNQEFLETILTSFKAFINIGTSRSTAKLIPLHGAIAEDVAERLGDGYKIWSKGYGESKELKVQGRYMNKNVDITVTEASTGCPVAGIAVKFVMQNYAQNSNNYFENMLGETANLRTAQCPYFQILIILDKLPYYNNKGQRTHWEEVTTHNLHKYIKLSEDDINTYYHTPNKTLIYIVHANPDAPENKKTKDEYMAYYRSQGDELRMEVSSREYEGFMDNGSVIINDYNSFIDKVFHTIMAR